MTNSAEFYPVLHPPSLTQRAETSVVNAATDQAPRGNYQTLTRRSLTLQSTPFAALPLPLIARAPSFRFGPNLPRACMNTSFTNSLLPITTPSVKYLTRQRNIRDIPKSFNTVSLSSLANISAVFFVV
jgi:hypothetical protein